MKRLSNLILIFFLSLLTQYNFAAVEPVNNRAQGADLYDLKGSASTLDIADNKFWIMGDGFWDTEFSIKSVQNQITLGIDESDMVYRGTSFAYRVELNVTYKQVVGLSLIDNTLEGIVLDIDYDPARGTTYRDRSGFSFTGGVDVQVEVVTIEKLVGGVWEEVITSSLPSSLYLESEIRTERYYLFNQTIVPPVTTTISSVPGELNISWPLIEGAEEYELEWTWVNGYSGEIDGGGNPIVLATSELNYDFKMNATRVRLQGKNTYTIPLIYGEGYILIRYRGIGRGGNDFSIPLEGKWNSDGVGLSGTSGLVSGYGTSGVNFIEVNAHEGNEINYGAGMSFIEDGVRSVGVTYMDGVLKARQSQADLNGQDKIIVGSTIYDHYGRPAIGVMSTPVDQSTLGYIDELNMHSDGTPYAKEHFDLDDPDPLCDVYTAAPPMSAELSQGAANYYSEENPDKEGFNAYLPDAKGYPFVQVEYSNDPTGRITRVGGIGPDHQLGEVEVDSELRNAHYTEYFYAVVDNEELYALFGNDVAAPANYTKIVTKDVHGQLSMGIIDPMGRTVATYMAGNNPTELEAIEGNSDVGSEVSKNFIDFNMVDDIEGVLEVNHPIFVEDPTVIYEFNYDFTAVNFSDCLLPTIDLCFDCIYDIEIIIRSDDKDCEIEDGAENIISEDGEVHWTYTVGSLEEFDPSSCDESPFTFSGVNGLEASTFNIKFPKVGNYQIIKKLKVSTTPIDYYWELYKENSTCLLSESFFIEEALTYIDPSDCEDLGPCEMSFLLENGTLAMYLEANPESTEAAYDALYETHLEECETMNSCDYMLPIMISDFKEGGQYSIKDLIIAKYADDTYSDELLDALFENVIGGLFNWQSLGPLYELDGSVSVIIDDAGVPQVAPYSSISPQELAASWKDSWAESFVGLHPEYCFYSFCGDHPEIFTYEADMDEIETFAEACSLGFVNPFPSGYGSLAGCSSNEDPIFDDALTAGIIAILNEDYEVGADVLDIYEYAVHACGDDFETVAFGTGCNADRHWKAFRSLYYSKRFRIIDRRKIDYVTGFSGCSDYARSVGTTTGPEGDNVFSTRIPRHLSFETFYFDLDPAFDWDAELGEVEVDMDEFCLGQCEDLADSWMEQLAGCDMYLPGGETWNDGQTTYDLVRAKLIEVCAGGCDAEWPMPRQIDPDATTDITAVLRIDWTFQSFEDVIVNLLGVETVECSHLLITNPLPSDGDESLINYLDECACDLLLGSTDLADFVAQNGFEPIDYTAEKCKCDAIDAAGDNNNDINGSEVTTLNAAEIFTANSYPCGIGCIDCGQMATYRSGFTTIYAETYLTEPLLFTAYVNEISGGNYPYARLIELIENCIALNTTETPIYHLLDPKTEEIRDLLNKLSVVGLTNDQLDRTLLTLPEYFSSSLYPCGDEDEAIYDYEPAMVGTKLTFNLTDETCATGFCSISLSLPDGLPAGFASESEVFENCESFGELYLLSPLYVAELDHFYITTVVNVPGGGTLTIPILVENSCYDFVTTHLTEYQGSPSFIICSDEEVPEEDDCLDLLIEEAELTGHEKYLEYLEAKEAEFRRDYIAACTAVDETFNTNYVSNRYHYTLLYYDQSGNLVKTVPPGGVDILTDIEIDGVIEHIEDPVSYAAVYPNHTFETTYKHNSLNQVIEVSTPDGGTNHYFYDHLGRLVVSQNAKQAVFKRGIITGDYDDGLEIPAYSYTLYDELGRVIEVGEISHPTPMTKAIAKDPAALQAWFDATTVAPDDTPVIRNNITLMYYDEEVDAEASAEFGDDGYGFTRNRITATEVISGYVSPTFSGWVYPAADYANHYKYDVHGNVETYLQEISDLAEFGNTFRRVDYDYDLISGNPNYIYYQKGKADQYIHQYIYDKDNRLKEVFTSNDGQIWDRDMNYEYREDGYLARAELGEMKVQGMDFAYTLHGWLKTMNSGVLNADYDMGRDGRRDGPTEYSALENEVHGLVAKDALAYTVGYYENDYQAISESTSDFGNMQMTIPGTSDFYDDRTNLYNGNITSLISNLTDYEGNRLSVTANTYHYDQLHRFKDMHVFSTTVPGGTTNSLATATRKNSQTFSITESDGSGGTRSVADYEMHVDYDKNGNISHLIRNAHNITGLDVTSSTVSDNGMDEFSYIYEANTNKLTQVTDNNDNEVVTIGASPVNFGDIKSGQGVDNYVYHPDGSLKSDLDEEMAYIDWYPSGKIKHIYRTETSEQADLYFEYDPMGIRTLKVEMTRTGTEINPASDWKYTYYAGDANGTTMAIYELDETDQDHTLQKTETMLYGGSRLGIDVEKVTVAGLLAPSEDWANKCNTDGLASAVVKVGPYSPVDGSLVQVKLGDVVLGSITWVGGDIEANANALKTALDAYANVTISMTEVEVNTFYIEIKEEIEGALAGDVTYVIAGSPSVSSLIRNSTIGDCYNHRTLGMKYYEISNYLGNVMEVVSDRKIAVDENTYDPTTGDFVTASGDLVIDWFEADVVQYSDYYPFGMEMPGLNGSISEKYRYAYNGMETDPEVSGSGNSYTTQFRQYDPRLGRWKSLDPLAAQFPWQSPFCAMDNNPVVLTDVTGLSTGNGGDGGGDGTINSPYKKDEFKVDDLRNADPSRKEIYYTQGGYTFKATYNTANGAWVISYRSASSTGDWTKSGRSVYSDYKKESVGKSAPEKKSSSSTSAPSDNSTSSTSSESNSSDSGNSSQSNQSDPVNHKYSLDPVGADQVDRLIGSVETTLSYFNNVSGYEEALKLLNNGQYQVMFNGELRTWSFSFNGNPSVPSSVVAQSRAAAIGAAQIGYSIKILGNFATVAGVTFSTYDFFSKVIDGTATGTDVAWYTADMGMTIITFIPVGGWIVGVVYFAAKTAIKTYDPEDPDNWANSSFFHSSICFIAGTKILMSDGGMKVIEQIVEGDSVMSYNFSTNKLEPCEVLKVDSPIHHDFVDIIFDSEITNTNTFDHPYFVKGKGWSSYDPELTYLNYGLECTKLNVGDTCYQKVEDKIIEVVILEIRSFKESQRSYNLTEVSKNHNYFANGILVHNKAVPDSETVSTPKKIIEDFDLICPSNE